MLNRIQAITWIKDGHLLRCKTGYKPLHESRMAIFYGVKQDTSHYMNQGWPSSTVLNRIQAITWTKDGHLLQRKMVSPRHNGPLTRYVKLRAAHAPGMPGIFSPLMRVSDPDMHHGTCVTHVPWCMPGLLTSGFLRNRWREKHSRRMRNPRFCVSGKRPMPSELVCPIFGRFIWISSIRYNAKQTKATIRINDGQFQRNMLTSIIRKY